MVSDLPPLSEAEEDVLDRFADAVVRRGMTAPAILFLESFRPMNFIASQAMVFFAPMVGLIVNRKDYDVVMNLLERRESIEHVLRRIEDRDQPD